MLLDEAQQRKTNTHVVGGSKPQWSELLNFDLRVTSRLAVEVWSYSTIGCDSLIGRGVIDLRTLLLVPGRAVQGS